MLDMTANQLVVTFFGDYTSEVVPLELVTLHTAQSTMTIMPTYHDGPMDGLSRTAQGDVVPDQRTQSRAIDELRRHVANIFEENPRFRLPSAVRRNEPLPFTLRAVRKYYG